MPPVVQAASIRHAAIIAAAIVAWRWQPEIRLVLLFSLSAAAAVNVAVAVFADLPRIAEVARWVSPSVGIVAWATLARFTGGVDSPMVAGFWLEIALSSLVLRPHQILLVAVAASASLWAQQASVRVAGSAERLLVETTFLAVTGALMSWGSDRTARTERALSRSAAELGRRLRVLEGELEQAQARTASRHCGPPRLRAPARSARLEPGARTGSRISDSALWKADPVRDCSQALFARVEQSATRPVVNNPARRRVVPSEIQCMRTCRHLPGRPRRKMKRCRRLRQVARRPSSRR